MENHLNVIKILVDKFSAEINPIHKFYGTPLHCAAFANSPQIVFYLLDHGAKVNVQTENGLLAKDICTLDEIKKIILEYSDETNSEQEEFYKDIQVPAKPPKVKGYIYKYKAKTNKIIKCYLLIDIKEYKLVIYDDIKDYPDNYKRDYLLENIKHVRRVTSADKNNKYSYFEFEYLKKHTLCCEHKHIAITWINYLNSALEYSNFITKLKKNINSPKSNRKEIEEFLKIAEAETSMEIELNDTIEEEKFISKSFTNTQSSQEEIKNLSEPSDKMSLSSFTILEKIGSGTYGSIFKVELKNTKKVYALKMISKDFLFKTKQVKYAMGEAQLLKVINHSFIIKMHFSFQDERFIYFVIDHCYYGDLSTQIIGNKGLEESAARFYIAELILAIEYLHSLEVVHRDLKPSNVLLAIDGHIRLADLGLAKQISGKIQSSSNFDEKKTFCGTLSYLAPEMLLKKSSGKTVDVYGIGAVLYELLVGYSLHFGENPKMIIKNIQAGYINIPKNLSKDARSVLKVIFILIK